MEVKIKKTEERREGAKATEWFKGKNSKFLKQMNSMDEEGKASKNKIL